MVDVDTKLGTLTPTLHSTGSGELSITSNKMADSLNDSADPASIPISYDANSAATTEIPINRCREDDVTTNLSKVILVEIIIELGFF